MARRTSIARIQAVAGEIWADAAAREILRVARSAIAARGVFRVTLAGGMTPKRAYEVLAESARRTPDLTDWSKWDVWFGDERCVRADSPDSNQGMAAVAMLARASPRPRVHAVPTSNGDAASVASAYEAELVREFDLAPGTTPVFDLVLLGLGADGHTASLFPGDPVLNETRRLVVPVRAPKPPPDRVTFTLPVLNAARELLFLVAGADKAAAVAAVLEGEDVPTLPAARVRPRRGKVTFLLDDAASSLLTKPD